MNLPRAGQHQISSLLSCYDHCCELARKCYTASVVQKVKVRRKHATGEIALSFSPGYAPKFPGRKFSWKITDAQREEIVRLYRAGKSFRAIGAAFGVSGHTAQYQYKKGNVHL